MTRRIKVVIKGENEKKKKKTRSYFFSYLTTKMRSGLRDMGNVTR